MTDLHIEIEVSDEVLGTNGYRAMLELTLDEDGACYLRAFDRHETMNGSMTLRDFRMRDIKWGRMLAAGRPVLADRDAIETLAKKMLPYVERVKAGHSVIWDGSNHVGRLTDDAREAHQALEVMISDATWTRDEAMIWDAAEWLGSDHGIEPEDTDEEIAAKIAEYEATAKADGVVLVYSHFWGKEINRAVSDMEDLLTAIRDDMLAVQALDEEDEE